MLFTLGIIVGILISVLIVLTLVFFKNPIEQKVNVIKKQVQKVGPRPRGFIVEPDSDADEIREEIIAKNQSEGKDTKIEDLRS